VQHSYDQYSLTQSSWIFNIKYTLQSIASVRGTPHCFRIKNYTYG